MGSVPKIIRERAVEITNRFAGKRIIVLGDIMLDEFIWGRVRRISPEAPVPVVEIEKQTEVLGGAGNVASNILALGARPVPIGIVGSDREADRVHLAFTSLGITTDGVAVDQSRPTTVKTRIIAHSQQVVRADRESRAAVEPEVARRVTLAFGRELQSADAVVVSDYGKGLLTPALLSETLVAARRRGLSVCLDPKSRDFVRYQPVTVITPNQEEAAQAAGLAVEGELDLVEMGRRLLASIECRAVLVTRGEEGMTLFTDDGDVTHIPAVAREVYDVTGAGDTVVATLTLALAAGATPIEGAMLANHAAGAVVAKVGTAVVDKDELLATIR